MAKDIFDKTIFDGYRVESLTESVQDIIPKYNFDGSTKTTVFISHKHDDLDEIKGFLLSIFASVEMIFITILIPYITVDMQIKRTHIALFIYLIKSL